MSFEVRNFIDIHTHILPGIDDGSPSYEESVALARCYVNVGIKKVVATPHFIPGTAWATPVDKVLEVVDAFQNILDNEGIDLKILSGMEIAFHKKLADRIERGHVLPLGDSKHYLVEPSFNGEQDSLLRVLSELLQRGDKIILAHPERINGLRGKIDNIRLLVAKGLLIQVNAGSLLGHFGRSARKTAQSLWDRDCFHLIASDTHDMNKRRPLGNDEWNILLADSVLKQMLQKCNTTLAKLFTPTLIDYQKIRR